jgi:predicted nucleic acid-binding protein
VPAYVELTAHPLVSPGLVDRLLAEADFVIAAHALIQADRLMTLDPKRYRQDFPKLRLVCGA